MSRSELCRGFSGIIGCRSPDKAVCSLYERCQSFVRNADSKTDSFLVRVGLCQGCPLSQILFIIFMDRISRCSQGNEGVWFGDLKSRSLLFADDMVMSASSVRNLRLSLEWVTVKCEASEMTISTSKLDGMILSQKKKACLL